MLAGSFQSGTPLCSRCRRLRSRTKSSSDRRMRCARQNEPSGFAAPAGPIAASRARQRLRDRGGSFNHGHRSV
ncbi:hypothetical protein C4K12_0156 [Pseudomonas chlororaphis subsp. aureofaciens]|nr:hypothetical protein C4K12_0156 [Pseudomonas chlororaphis subsp. aureofaciens]